jgi:hypothetical protein
MTERVAILAGAGGELGRVTAQALAAAGTDRSEDGLRQLPDGTRYEVGDPSDPAGPGTWSTGAPPRSACPRCWSTPSAPITWVVRWTPRRRISGS